MISCAVFVADLLVFLDTRLPIIDFQLRVQIIGYTCKETETLMAISQERVGKDEQ